MVSCSEAALSAASAAPVDILYSADDNALSTLIHYNVVMKVPVV